MKTLSSSLWEESGVLPPQAHLLLLCQERSLPSHLSAQIPYSLRSPFRCHLPREGSPDRLCKITPPMPSLHFIFVIAPAPRSPTFWNVSAPLTRSELTEHGGRQGPFVQCYNPLLRIVTNTCRLDKYWSHECIFFFKQLGEKRYKNEVAFEIS